MIDIRNVQSRVVMTQVIEHACKILNKHQNTLTFDEFAQAVSKKRLMEAECICSVMSSAEKNKIKLEDVECTWQLRNGLMHLTCVGYYWNREL